jgi:hypothetical protein
MDQKIEEFWLGLKTSMLNFYNNCVIKRPIDTWSNNLNVFQKHKNYSSIEKHIINYISLYALDLMRLHDEYHIRILVTNMRRWDKISLSLKIVDSNSYEFSNIVLFMLDVYHSLLKYDSREYKTIFDEIELILIYNNFDMLLDYLIAKRHISIIDKLIKRDQQFYQILINKLGLTNIHFAPIISTKKLFKLIDKRDTNP